MPVFSKGSFSINLGIVSIGGELSEEDRQCAWELYCELVSSVALVGKLDEHGKQVFVGERYDQSLDSLYAFVTEARGLMRRYPVGRIAAGGAQKRANKGPKPIRPSCRRTIRSLQRCSGTGLRCGSSAASC